MNKGLCCTCANSIACSTWAEWKCLIQKRRIYEYADMTSCPDYKKRDKDFKESKCQCEDCLKNESLMDRDTEDTGA